jgi:hypothetical protein
MFASLSWLPYSKWISIESAARGALDGRHKSGPLAGEALKTLLKGGKIQIV